MSGAGILHAAATFCEIGLGITAILLVKAPEWRDLIRQTEMDEVKKENLRVQNREAGFAYRCTFWLGDKLNSLKLALPFLAFIFGVVGLICMSSNWARDKWVVFAPNSDWEHLIWWFGFLSFFFALLSTLLEQSKVRAIHQAETAKRAKLT